VTLLASLHGCNRNAFMTTDIGDVDIAVSFFALHLAKRDNTRRIVVDATKEESRGAPAFEGRKQ
jgi:hypothetical protein